MGQRVILASDEIVGAFFQTECHSEGIPPTECLPMLILTLVVVALPLQDGSKVLPGELPKSSH
jgi:hypothetical protein